MTTTDGAVPARHDTGSITPLVMLVMATLGFALNFWAWALLSPLGPLFRATGEPLGALSEGQVALMVAVPVLVGSLGRIPVGALTDRFGGRLMFPLVSAITIVPILFLGFVGIESYAMILLGGFFLGVSGTAFAVGVPFVNAWFPPERRGFAVGVFGAGMGGTAISALTTVRLFERDSTIPFVITAIALAAYAVLAWLIMRDAPGRVVPTTGMVERVMTAAKHPVTWQAAILYVISFGGYVAFSVYLPAFLRATYELTPADAANRMAGFVLVAVIMRPVGGWLSDRYGAVPVLAATYMVVTVLAAGAIADPPVDTVGAIVFLTMAAALGAGSGATFALIAQATEPAMVGGVTGLVGAAGGFGGFVPPLLMGWIYGLTSSYSIGLWLLSVSAIVTLVLTLTIVRSTAERAQEARRA